MCHFYLYIEGKEELKMGAKINEIGNVYGYLTVIAPAPSKNNRAMWKCKCKCGNECEVSGKLLRSGHTKSCGCLKSEVTAQRNMERGGGDLAGQRFGKLTVLRFEEWLDHGNGHRDRMWRCKCDCGNECIVNHRYLRNGNTESCGCIKSRGNATIMQWLNANHYIYQAEYGFKDLVAKGGNPYLFDFAIFNGNKELKCLIEYQGNIHFETGSGWNNETALADCQRRDKIKFDYCQENNIKLYYITYKEIIENRLKEIMDEQFATNN